MDERLKLTGLAVAIVAPLALSVWTLGAGHRERVEVERHTLRVRTSQRYVLPLVEAALTAERREELESPLTRYLREQGWTPAQPEVEAWVGARGWSAGRPSDTGPARALHEALCERAGAWVAWSHAHPAAAARLWPRVLAAVRDGRCHDAGALLQAANPAS